jgi:hypothetical protein
MLHLGKSFQRLSDGWLRALASIWLIGWMLVYVTIELCDVAILFLIDYTIASRLILQMS